MSAAPIYARPVDAPRIFGISRSTLYRWAAAGYVTIHRRGGASFVRIEEVCAFIEGNSAALR